MEDVTTMSYPDSFYDLVYRLLFYPPWKNLDCKQNYSFVDFLFTACKIPTIWVIFYLSEELSKQYKLVSILSQSWFLTVYLMLIDNDLNIVFVEIVVIGWEQRIVFKVTFQYIWRYCSQY